MGMQEFLVAYDCGMGGLWAIIVAQSAEAITRKYPEVSVARERPAWMDDDRYATLRAERLALDSPSPSPSPEGILEVIVAERGK